MSSLEAAIGQLPQPILDKLQSMIRRVRRLLFIRGFCATLAVGLVCLLSIMAIDAMFTLFSTAARWALSLTGLAITAVAAWWFLIRPLSRKFTLTHMARILEIRHPELQERISTAVELMSSDDPDSIKGSEELIEAVVDSAIDDVEAVDPNTEFKPARAAKFIKIAAVCLGLLVVTLAIWPKQSWTLLSRALAPFLDIGNAYASTLVIDPGDIRVARGEPVTIEVSIQQKRLKRAEIRRKLEDGSETVERMSLIGEDDDGTKRFSLTFPSVAESFDYRVRAGSAVSEFFDVDAVDPPEVSALTIEYDYPDYTKKETVSSKTETGEIRAVAHTRVSVSAELNRSPWTAKLFLNESREMGTPKIEDNLATWEFEIRSGMSGNWRIELADEEGFQNEPTNYPIEVLPDKAPTVQITQPNQREFKLRPTETLPIEAAVTEDFGIADFSLLVTPQGDPSPTQISQPAPQPANRSGSYYGKAQLKLASLNLRPDQKKLSVQLRAEDNRPADYDGPGVGLSEMILITIDRNAKSLADQAIEEQKKKIDQTIREARQELERARDDINRTEQELRRSDDVSRQAREKLDEFSEHTDSAREKLSEITAALDNSIFQEQADQAEKISNEKLAKAREAADLIPVSDDKNERVADARSAKKEIEESIRELDQLARSMREADDDYRAISEINQLANKQQELAQKAEEFAEESRRKAEEMQAQQANEKAQQQFDQQQKRELDQFKSEQKQVEQKLGQMLKDNAAALAEVLEDQREEANALAEEAKALAQQQEQLKESNEQALRSKPEDQEDALREQLLAQLESMQKEVAEETAAAQQNQSSQTEENAKSDQQENGPSSPESAESGEAMAENSNQPQTENGEPTPNEPSGQEASSQESAQEMAEQGNEAPSNSPNQESQGSQSEPEMAASESLSSAAEQTEEAAEQLSERNLDAATEAATEAGESLAEAAEKAETAEAQSGGESSSGDSGETSDSSPSELAGSEEPSGAAPGEETSPASELSELSEKQQAIAEQIAAVRDGKLQEALSMMEAMMNREASALQTEAQAFERSMQSLQQNSARSSSDQAEQALARGAQEAQNAARGLDQAQQQQARAAEQGRTEEGQFARDAQQSMQRSLSDQQQSQAQFDRAAQMLSQASKNIGQTLDGLEPSDMDDRITNSEDLAEGFNEVSEASDAQSAQEAAQEAQEAASSLQQLAQQAMQKLGNGQQGNQPSDPNQQGMPQPNQDLAGDPESTNLNETGEKKSDSNGDGVPPELRELGISAEDWARFKGALVGGNATAIETELPAEYRELVGRYFQVIAKEAGK